MTNFHIRNNWILGCLVLIAVLTIGCHNQPVEFADLHEKLDREFKISDVDICRVNNDTLRIRVFKFNRMDDHELITRIRQFTHELVLHKGYTEFELLQVEFTASESATMPNSVIYSFDLEL